MEWWRRIMFPLQRVWTGRVSSTRVTYRKTGLLMLHREVKACEYEDVHIMWEMLKKNDTILPLTNPAPTRRRIGNDRPLLNLFSWARFGSCLGRP